MPSILTGAGRTIDGFTAQWQLLAHRRFPSTIPERAGRSPQDIHRPSYGAHGGLLDHVGLGLEQHGTTVSLQISLVKPTAGIAITIPFGTSLENGDRELILASLKQCGDATVRAAQILGISLKTLYNRLTECRAAQEIESDDADTTGEVTMSEIPIIDTIAFQPMRSMLRSKRLAPASPEKVLGLRGKV